MDIAATREAIREATAIHLVMSDFLVNEVSARREWKNSTQGQRDHFLTKADALLKSLSSLGVCLVVEGELPENPIIPEDGYMLAWTCYNNAQQDMLEADYVKTCPIVEKK
jgi:hypothetical protein